MTLNERIDAFSNLGTFFGQFSSTSAVRNTHIPYQKEFYPKFLKAIQNTVHQNGWFTEENIRYTFTQWSTLLTIQNLNSWLAKYALTDKKPITVGIVMAGNIPLVGFHDFLCVLITGNSVKAKQSSDDSLLLPLIVEYLIALHPDFETQIVLTDQRLNEIDAVIATGSNNTARYFEYYFRDTPSIIRKNRNSVAVLTGDETKVQLEALGEDIFRYYGLGCRSVSKIFVPESYNFDLFFQAIYPFRYLIEGTKYANNYDYNKAVYLMSNFKLLENGFLILKEDASFSSPIASLFYEYYDDINTLASTLLLKKEDLQCVVGELPGFSTIAYGETQRPSLHDYADGVDVIEFLKKINL